MEAFFLGVLFVCFLVLGGGVGAGGLGGGFVLYCLFGWLFFLEGWGQSRLPSPKCH